jgi:hypothetical protein
MSSYQVPASFGLGTSRDAAPCSAPPDKHRPIRSSDVCFPNSRLRLPVLAGSRHCPRDLRLVRSNGLWDPPHDRGRGRTRCVRNLRFGVPHWPLIRGFQPCRGCYPPTRPMRPTSSIPVASPTRFSLDLFTSRLRVGPPGRELPRPVLPLPREQQRRGPIRDGFHG